MPALSVRWSASVPVWLCNRSPSPSASPCCRPRRCASFNSPALRSGFLDGLICNVTNPKVFLFFVGVFAQVIPPGAGLALRLAVPAAVVLHGLVLWSLIVLALRSPPVATQLARAQHWLPRVFGVALLTLAAFLVWEALAA